MARPSAELIVALRETATRLSLRGSNYRWSSFAHCNCGHLAQTISGLAPDEIQRRAMHKEGDWGRQARDWEATRTPCFDYGDRPALDEGAWEPEDEGACPVSGTGLDALLAQMCALGLRPEDVERLERLSDPEVRRRLGTAKTHFAHYERENVIAYLMAWADLLEERLAGAELCESLPQAAE
jgi:hypothetical protein